jgi:hypothetical protein
MQLEAVERFFGWINERHAIYQSRAAGNPPPWTDDPILSQYKFTNPFRENDRVTVWMRENWTKPNDNRPHGEIIFNCCLFRMVGTSEFAEAHGWATSWDPDFTKTLILDRLSRKERTFTGAYIITNQGLKCSKAEVVVDHFLTPIWEDKEHLAEVANTTNSLQATHKAMASYRGWGGGGFMSYEVVTDLNHTPVLAQAEDRLKWANAGPGAVRGLNRIYGRDLKKGMNQEQANKEMFDLLLRAGKNIGSHIKLADMDMRVIEHSLCEWDKYERVRLKQGTPRSKFDAHFARQAVRGSVT